MRKIITMMSPSSFRNNDMRTHRTKWGEPLQIMVISLFLLSACTHQPMPIITAPTMTRDGTPMVQNTSDIIPIQWFQKMHDPVLDRLIKTALLNNNQILTARANILQAQAQLKMAQLTWLPTLNLTGNGFIGGSWNSDIAPQGALAQSGALAGINPIRFRGYYSGFMPSYSLNILQNLSTNQLAKASLDMQKAIYQSTRQSIISQISGAYFMLLGQKKQQHIQLQLIHHLETSHQLEKVRLQAGASELSPLTQLEQHITNQKASLKTIDNSVAQIENAIQVLLNHNPGPIATNRDINTLSIQGLIPKNLSSTVLKNRPDILMAEANLNMSEANLGIAYSHFFPTLSLTSLLGGASLELTHLLSLSTGAFVAEMAASMPLLNGKATAQITAARAGTKAAYFTYAQTLRAAFADVDNSLTHQQKVNAAYDEQRKAFQATQTLYLLACTRHQSGATDYREVINAKINRDYAKLDLNLAKMQQLDSLVGVYQALANTVASH